LSVSSPDDGAPHDAEEDPQLVTRQLSLRQLVNEDAVLMAHYLSDWDVVKQTTSVPYPYDERSALTWIGRVRNRQADGLQYVFALTKRGEDRIIGTVSVGLVKDADRTHGEIGYWLGKPFWGSGFASEAVHAMTSYIFETMNIDRIEAAVFKENAASARVLEKSGYGLLRTETRRYADRGGKRKVLCYVINRENEKEDLS